MATVGTYVKPKPIGHSVITTDDVIAAGYDFVYLKMGGMLKVQGQQVNSDLTVGMGAAYLPPADLAFIGNLPATASVVAGENHTMLVNVNQGHGVISFAWYKDDVLIPNEVIEYLTIIDAESSDAGVYHVVVSDSKGPSITSVKQTLTVS